MTPSPLDLEKAFFTRVDLQAAEAEQVVGPGGYETQVQMGHHPEDPRHVQVALTVKLLPAEQGVATYRGEVRAMAFLRIKNDVTDDKIHRLAAVHGASLLYGMIREQICAITARGPWPMFVLPTTNFSDLDVTKPSDV